MSPEEKKVNINLSIKKSLYDQLKAKGVNVSALFEEFAKKLMEKE